MISRTLETPSFPLSPTVLATLGDLTDTELITFAQDGGILDSTLTGEPPGSARVLSQALQSTQSRRDSDAPGDGAMVRISGIDGQAGYLVRSFRREASTVVADSVVEVAVLFDEESLTRARWQAASLPLATGLSTLAVLSLVSWLIARRLVARISTLQMGVEQIAAGNFDTDRLSEETSTDELGKLSSAVRTMSLDLKTLWSAVHRGERQKLIHQMAAGLAHQVRNSLTGARMALEIHSRSCSGGDEESLRVADSELSSVEDYVNRIMRVASGDAASPEVGAVTTAFEDNQRSLAAIARHQQIALSWHIDAELADCNVPDIRSLSAAIQNLVMNGLQAGATDVSVQAGLPEGKGQLQVVVSDNGPGLALSTDDDIFEAFVTSKPEGLGLGLSVVRRAAEALGGEVHWHRSDHRTHFVFTAKLQHDS